MRRMRTALIQAAALVPLAVVVGVLGASAGSGTHQSPLDTIADGARWAVSSPGAPVNPSDAAAAAKEKIVQACTSMIVVSAVDTMIDFTLNGTHS